MKATFGGLVAMTAAALLASASGPRPAYATQNDAPEIQEIFASFELDVAASGDAQATVTVDPAADVVSVIVFSELGQFSAAREITPGVWVADARLGLADCHTATAEVILARTTPGDDDKDKDDDSDSDSGHKSKGKSKSKRHGSSEGKSKKRGHDDSDSDSGHGDKDEDESGTDVETRLELRQSTCKICFIPG
jgi:hypothetical protein